jgi:hypothetical protein
MTESRIMPGAGAACGGDDQAEVIGARPSRNDDRRLTREADPRALGAAREAMHGGPHYDRTTAKIGRGGAPS